MRNLLPNQRPALVLAPMQDVTDLPFMKVMHQFGDPDWYVTEYFRVVPEYRLNRYILRSITENPTGRPIYAQLIGNQIEHMQKSVRDLEQYAIAGVDLNLGCPAPTVYKKCAGGGLLRDLERVDRLIGGLREAIQGKFTIKTRVGFETETEFEALLNIFAKHAIDGLTVHGRTVLERYRTPVHVKCIRAAVERLTCPVIANANVVDVQTGLTLQAATGAAGVMIGRGAIRNPLLFKQLKAAWAGEIIPQLDADDLMRYIELLWDETAVEHQPFHEGKHVNKMKKYLLFLAQGLGDAFEAALRRVKTKQELFQHCRDKMENLTEIPPLPPVDSQIFCGFSKLLDEA